MCLGLASLVICVGYSYVKRKRGVALVKFKPFPSPMQSWDIYMLYGTCMHTPVIMSIKFPY